MITGDIKNQVDRIWDSFWSGGISNPLEVIEQLTYLLFIRRLDDLHTLAENKSAKTKKPIDRRIFPEGKEPRGRAYDECRVPLAVAAFNTMLDTLRRPDLKAKVRRSRIPFRALR